MLRVLKTVLRDRPVLRAAALRGASLLRSIADAPPGLYTLCYHRIPVETQEQFSRQLTFLRRHGAFLDADHAAEHVAAGWPSGERAFLLTFDDGYADNVDVALPVIAAHGVPAILFLVSDWLDAPPAPSGARDHMTREDAATWCGAGLQIGSHTATHTRLSTLDAGAIRNELERSRDALSALSGRPVAHFACPWGVAGADFNAERDTALAAACGYRTFYTTRRGRARGADDLMLMPRHVVEPHWRTYELDALLGSWRRARSTR